MSEEKEPTTIKIGVSTYFTSNASLIYAVEKLQSTIADLEQKLIDSTKEQQTELDEIQAKFEAVEKERDYKAYHVGLGNLAITKLQAKLEVAEKTVERLKQTICDNCRNKGDWCQACNNRPEKYKERLPF